jgi:hypothetical protein
MVIKTTKKMLMKMVGLKLEFQHWIVRLAAVISNGLEVARLALQYRKCSQSWYTG